MKLFWPNVFGFSQIQDILSCMINYHGSDLVSRKSLIFKTILFLYHFTKNFITSFWYFWSCFLSLNNIFILFNFVKNTVSQEHFYKVNRKNKSKIPSKKLKYKSFTINNIIIIWNDSLKFLIFFIKLLDIINEN